MVLANQAQVRRRRHAEQFGGGTDGELLASNDSKLPFVRLETRAPKCLALAPGAAQPRLHALYDERPFKLRDGCDDREDGLPERAPGVDLLSERDELHVEVSEEFEGL